MSEPLLCPHCGGVVKPWRNPAPTVDVVLEHPEQGVLLIERKNPPHGFALPGGFVDYGESAEAAAVREAKEETGLEVELTGLLGVYSDPGRDPRGHTLAVVYTAKVRDWSMLNAGDDAKSVRFVGLDPLPQSLAFDHQHILRDYKKSLPHKEKWAKT